MGLLDRVAAALPGRAETRYSADTYVDLLQQVGLFGYGGTQYPYGLRQTAAGQPIREVAETLPGYMAALQRCPPAFAAQMVRALVLSQARFRFRRRLDVGNRPRVYGTTALATLEEPWPKGTTGELLARMEWHAGLAGNAYVARRPDRLQVLRPDWVGLLYGSDMDPDYPDHALDGKLLGYVYANGGWPRSTHWKTLLPDEVTHWSPLPDPLAPSMGMSWITPAVREIQGDVAATDHKLMFFANGATPNLVVKGIAAATLEQFREIVDEIESTHAGVANAYRTLYLTAGADATVVGADLKQMDFKATQGAGETRIAVLSRVPAPLLGISEGLAGSSLNAGNFGMARRMFADTWVYPTLQDLSAALAAVVAVPGDSELWPDVADMPILREDAKDAAEIEQIKQVTISGYVRDGFTAASAVAAVQGQNIALLEHTGLLSVQLQPPGQETPAPPSTAGGTS